MMSLNEMNYGENKTPKSSDRANPWIHVVGILAVIVCVIVVCIRVLPIETEVSGGLTTYTISSDLCKQLFYGMDPNRFMDGKNPFPLLTDTFCTSAHVDESGNLVVSFDKEQLQQWKEISMDQIEPVLEGRATISDDYKEIKVEYPSWGDYINSSVLLESLYAIPGCLCMQLLNGENPSDVVVTYIVVDLITQDEIYRADTSDVVTIKYTVDREEGRIYFQPE